MTPTLLFAVMRATACGHAERISANEPTTAVVIRAYAEICRTLGYQTVAALCGETMAVNLATAYSPTEAER